MSNYPDGTWAGDPNAPWNAPDAPTCICDHCDVEREEWEPDTVCEDCETGTMRDATYTREDYEADMADQRYDEMREERY